MQHFKNHFPGKDLIMDEEDRQTYLKLLKNAHRLLTDKPFTFKTVFDVLSDYLLVSDLEIQPLVYEVDWSDSQILDLLYIKYNYNDQQVFNDLKAASWDIDRFWRAVKDLVWDDSDIVGILNYYGCDLNSVVDRLMSDNWGYPRIIKALDNWHSITTTDKLTALTRRSNDFRIIELLPIFCADESDFLGHLPNDWGMDRIIRAFSSAGYSDFHIIDILSNNFETEEIFKAFLTVASNPMTAVRNILLYDSDLIDDIIVVFKDNKDLVSNSEEIVEQLEKTYSDIEYYLENGFFEE